MWLELCGTLLPIALAQQEEAAALVAIAHCVASALKNFCLAQLYVSASFMFHMLTLRRVNQYCYTELRKGGAFSILSSIARRFFIAL